MSHSKIQAEEAAYNLGLSISWQRKEQESLQKNAMVGKSLCLESVNDSSAHISLAKASQVAR